LKTPTGKWEKRTNFKPRIRPQHFKRSQKSECPQQGKKKPPNDLKHHQTNAESQQIQKCPTTNPENEIFNGSKDK
jgi:hypothetical protein